MPTKGVCFVAMPAGKTEADQLLFHGWFELVYRPAIESAGYEPYLQLAQSAPIRISAEIRRHLVESPMALFDLGGSTRDEVANPNVMYELGIRHAFGKPAVLYSWGVPPFDVAEQHATLLPREKGQIGEASTRLTKAISEAEQGRFYDPMEGVAIANLARELGQKDAGLQPIVALLTQLMNGQDALSAEISAIRSRQSLPDYPAGAGGWLTLAEGLGMARLHPPSVVITQEKHDSSQGDK